VNRAGADDDQQTAGIAKNDTVDCFTTVRDKLFRRCRPFDFLTQVNRRWQQRF